MKEQTNYVGYRQSWGAEPSLFGISASDRRHHVYVIGKTGTGKSTVLERLAGEGCAVLYISHRLDEILELHVEQCRSAEEIVAEGYDEQTVRRILRLVRIAEFKRKQAAPVLKVTSRAFGTGWRMPIVRQE